MKVGSTKQCKDPESNKALKIIKRDISEVVTERYKVSDSKGAAALSLTSFGTRIRSKQPLVRAESERLLSIFSSLLSLPNLSPKSNCFRSELFDDEAESRGVNGFLPFLFGLFECEEEGLAGDFSRFLFES